MTRVERRGFVVGTLTLLAAPLAVEAQPPKVPRLGFLGISPAAAYASRIEGPRQGLRELGYIGGRISRSNGGMRIRRLNGFPVSPRSSSASTWM
jgi:hypothetical protein